MLAVKSCVSEARVLQYGAPSGQTLLTSLLHRLNAPCGGSESSPLSVGHWTAFHIECYGIVPSVSLDHSAEYSVEACHVRKANHGPQFR
jgi:hypothetical protein